MEHFHDSNRRVLRPEASTLSDVSMESSSTFVASPTPPSPPTSIHHRSSYHRVPTLQEQDISYQGARDMDEDTGLRIQNMKGTAQGPSIEISYSGESSPAVPGSAGLFLSPSLSRSSKKNHRALEDTPEDEMEAAFYPGGRDRSESSYRPFTADSENETLRIARRSSRSTLSPYGPTGGEHPDFTCTTKQHFHHRRGDVPSILVLIASAFSTIFSAIWLGLGTGKPHYGEAITHSSRLPPSTASLLVAAFAKAIELTFVTSFVAFLGQLLSQRAFRKNSKGITVAEMQMRSWILQPGTLITHSAAVRYAAVTLLGALAVFATLLAMFYTTASDALVSPKLKFGAVQNKVLYGKVFAQFANETYIQSQCSTPIPLEQDTDHGGQTCIALEHSGQAYHNYMQYLGNWTNSLTQASGYRNISLGSVSTDLAHRPLPVGTLYDNTTVQGSWIDRANMTEDSNKFNRMVNNVSLAMPHSAVYAAATDPRNRILQPQDLDGLGEYFLEASVPAPAVNVLCAAMTSEELAPMIVTSWPAYNTTPFNLTKWPAGYDIPDNSSWLNATAVDDIFGFGEKYGRHSPIFPFIPDAYNTLLNYTSFPVDGDSLYVLTRSPTNQSVLCSLRASLSPECSTKFHSTMSGGSMSTHCDGSHNALAYSKSQPSATSGVYIQGWRDVAAQWAIALSLNAGISASAASNARLLSQLIPTEYSLSPKLPSIAEALAELAGCTLIMSGLDSPLIHYWNYTEPGGLLKPQYQGFNATLQVQDYSSGGTQKWQGIFYVVLVSVFFINLFCLGYFITHTGFVTDFMEPQNLFALSLNSPPSQVLEGTCGGGPEKEQYKSTWHIWMNQSEHFYIDSSDETVRRRRQHTRTVSGQEFEMEGSRSPVSDMYDRLSTKRSSLL